jgi:hypothetical protein
MCIYTHIPVVGSVLVVVGELEAEDVVHELNSNVVAHCTEKIMSDAFVRRSHISQGCHVKEHDE